MRSSSAKGAMPKVGRPDASISFTPCCCTRISDSRLRGVISFLALVSVPSKSSTRSLYFISRFCLGFEGAKVVVLGINRELDMRPIKLIWGIGGTLLVALLIGCYFFREVMR